MLGGANRKYYSRPQGTPYRPPHEKVEKAYTQRNDFFENTEHVKYSSLKEKKNSQNLPKIRTFTKSNINRTFTKSNKNSSFTKH